MSINLDRFNQKVETIIPLIDGWGQFEDRKIYAKKEDGWYHVTLSSTVTIHGRASPLEIFKTIKECWKRKICSLATVYAIGEEGVPTNFEAFFRKGFGESVKVHFMNMRLFEVAKVALWEDNRFYFYEHIIPKNQHVIQTVREYFNQDKDLRSVREITPELRYVFLISSLQRDGVRTAQEMEKLSLSEAERLKRVEEFKKTFHGRLENTITKAGGTLVRYSKLGKGYLVEWKIGGQLVKSTIKDDMRILNAGYCLNNDDKKHSMSSIINLAKLFQKEAPLYITRE